MAGEGESTLGVDAGGPPGVPIGNTVTGAYQRQPSGNAPLLLLLALTTRLLAWRQQRRSAA